MGHNTSALKHSPTVLTSQRHGRHKTADDNERQKSMFARAGIKIR